MGAYILRRLLLMIPTFLGILIITFALLRMNGLSLTARMMSEASGKGGDQALKVQQASRNVQNYIDRFRREGNDLPALINLRGWMTKADVEQVLQDSLPGGVKTTSQRNQSLKGLWLAGHFAIKPLYEVLDDPALSALYPAASVAFSYCAYRTVDLDFARAHPEQLNAIQADNDLLYTNRIEDAADPRADEKRRVLLGFYAADPRRWAHTAARQWSALLLETGFVDFNVKLFTGKLWSETKQEYAFTIIGQRWYISFGLNFISIILAWLISIPLGIRSARRIDTVEDKVTTTTLFLLWSLPSFFVGTLLLHLLCTDSGTHHHLFPNRDLSSPDSLWFTTPHYLCDLAWHAALPLLVLTYSSFTALSRYMRGNLLDQLQSDYIRTARAKGCSDDQVVYGHAVRNSMLTMITLAGGLLSDLFGGFVVVEYIFSIQGLGSLTLDAAQQFDAPLVMASTVISVVLLLFGMLVADILYAVVDPRLRGQFG